MTVTVLGSANADLVLRVPRIPAAGETLLATGTARRPGGKGANQAVAAARAGALTTFLGAVGDDNDGELLRFALASAGVDITLLRTVSEPTGLAVVSVAADGQNSIVVVAGANGTVTELNRAECSVLSSCAVLLCQSEIPMSAVLAGAHAAHEAGAKVVFNAAPARELPDELWALIDVLIVNEHEAAELAASIDALLVKVPEVVVTLGAAGARYAARDIEPIEVPAPRVAVVDTTGAGDTFCGVLAADLAARITIPAALPRAAAAAALSVQRPGTISSIPTAAEIDDALR
jgi:ribokinase